MRRKQRKTIERDLEKKMVFLTGPRQVGKTWLAREIASSWPKSLYLNYDSIEDRNIILREAWLPDTEMLVLDELHKMPEWKNYLKGLYDTKPPGLRILVTGSARLDTFREAGDSLAGRFFRHRLLPFSPAELKGAADLESLDPLMERGGFPEPFLAGDDADARRWRLLYVDGLVRTDILDFEMIHDFRAIRIVFELLRRRVGSPVSYNSIAGDAGIAPNTVKKYIQIFEALFIVFRVTPHSRNIARSLLKEPKIYFYDTGLVEGDRGARFENLTAISLLKHAWGLADAEGLPYELRYLRSKDGAEVDFCIVNGDVPELIIETKVSDDAVSKSLRSFSDKYGISAIQLVLNLKRERIDYGIEVRRALEYLGELKY